MVDDFHRRHLVVAANVVGDPRRDTGNPRLLPRHALRDAHEGLDRRGDGVGIEQARGAGPVAVLLDRPVVGRTQPARFVDRGMRVGIVPRGQRAHEHFGGRVFDGLLEVLHGRFRGLEQAECPRKDAVLERRVVRHAEGPPEREVAEQAPRR